MFLTRIALDPGRYRAETLLRSTQRMHAAIAASFPDGPGGRVLWRLEPGATGGQIHILVASPCGPDTDEVTERITTPTQVMTHPYGPLLDQLAAGDRYRFRATLNPVRTHKGRHTPLFEPKVQIDWAAEKLAAHGAQAATDSPDLDTPAADIQVTGTRSDTFPRRDGMRVELLKVTFDGSLRVTDPDKLRTALCHGIGRAKGYGCGLMTLARA